MLEGKKQITDAGLEKKHALLIRAVANNVAKLRKKQKLTHEELAEIAGLNLRFYMKAVSGKHGFNLVTLIRLAEALGVSVSELLEQ
jgi:transcriptional regulator with XRE-family HTH domain